ncbi:hypothetical protein V6N13_098041 [Hibiscus sabdariffa]|uniref:Uncharacterized protein n=1 Tax=Hibiscus sabdariffa TaxID=183260 RepID=A0ABR2NVF2_9ROSI
MGRDLESNTVSAALARLLFLSMSIGISSAVASAQVKPQNVLPPALAPGGGGCDKTMSCSFKCGLLGCLVGCLKNPTIKCSAMCYFENVSCQVGCTLFDIRRPPSPAEP